MCESFLSANYASVSFESKTRQHSKLRFANGSVALSLLRKGVQDVVKKSVGKTFSSTCGHRW